MEPYAGGRRAVRRLRRRHCEGESPCFVEWARGVAADPEVLGLGRRAARAEEAAEHRLRGRPLARRPRARAVRRAARRAARRRRHDPRDDHGPVDADQRGRPAGHAAAGLRVAGADGPVALIEAGASAGLNLFPDRWGYAWSTPDGVVELGPAPHLPCEVTGPAPLPTALPEVAWRGGVDLNPLDVTDPDAMAWLETLVWPEQDDRRARLRHAVASPRADPPRLVRGDLLDELPALVAEASAHGTVVVFHSAVAAYLPLEQRAPVPGADARAGRRRRLPLGQQRGAERAAGRHRHRAGGRAHAPALRARRRRPDGGRTHGHGQYLDWLA